MANDNTGVLGESALGDFVLGDYELTAVLDAFITQYATEVLDVYLPSVLMTAINCELFYASVPYAVATQIAVEVLSKKTQSLVMTQETVEILDQYSPFVRTTQIANEVLETFSPKIRLTQLASEVLDVYDPGFRLTQEAVEILYQYIAPTDINFTTALVVDQVISHSSIINRTITSAINVGQIIAGQTYQGLITTNATVSQIITARNSTIHASVTSSITVTPTIKVNEDRVLSVVSSITVATDVQHHPETVSLSVQDNITVSQIITKNEVISLSVTSNITVTSSVSIHSAEVDMSVTTSLTVTQAIAFRNTVIRISMLQSIGASQASAERSTNPRLEIEDDIGVNSIIVARNTNVRNEVFSTLTLTATVFARSTIIHELVTDNVTVTPTMVVFNPNIAIESDISISQIIATRNTVVRLSLESGITVVTQVRHSPNIQSLQDNITVDGSGFGTAINFYIDPIPYTIVQPIYLTDTITGGNSNRQIAMEDDITVTQTIRTNSIYESFTDTINVGTSVVGGRDTRDFSFEDDISVSQTIFVRNNIIRQAVTSNIQLNYTITAITREIPVAVTSSIIVNPIITPRLVQQQNMHDSIQIAQIILDHPDNNHQSVIDTMTVSQSIRSSPNYQTIVQPVTVSSRIRQLELKLISEITVDQTINIQRSRLLIQKLPITQVLTANRDVYRSIRSDIAVAQTIKANHDYIRNLVSKLIIPEYTYNLQLDFNDSPISVPVVIGTIVTQLYMSIQGQHGSIVLPAAQLGDGIAPIGKIEVRKSMDGTSFSYIQNTPRQKLTYKWLLSHLKMYELRTFVRNSISDLLTMVNWKGETWMVKITKNPFEFENQGVWVKDGEYAEVEMIFEGQKLS